MKSSATARVSRRRFLGTTGIALAAPMIVPATVFGQGRPAPSNRITLASIGWGMQGPGNTRAFMNLPECQVVAVCDVDKNHLKSAVDTVNGKYGNRDCKTYEDYQELLARKDIDSVMIALPDTWHALVAVEAAQAKKDIYGEKPLARTIAEQRAMVNAVEANQRVWQTGSWQRSTANFHYASEIVRNGLIGKINRVEVGLPSGHHDFAGTGKFRTVTAPPPELNYDRWIGTSSMQPYIKARVHMNWRWDYNIGGGQLLDWVGHHCDIAHWGLGFDRIGPTEIEGTGVFPPRDAVWNTATKYYITCQYPQDVTMILGGGYGEIRSGTKWIGSDGWVWVDRGGFDTSLTEFKDLTRMPENQRKVKLYYSRNHQKDFLDCVKSRKPTITPVQTANNSTIPGHLGLISMMVGRKIKWDQKTETIAGDVEASKLLTRAYRAPWKFPGA